MAMRDGGERTECWNCEYERPVFEACPRCGKLGSEEGTDEY